MPRRMWIDTNLNNTVTIGTQFLVSLMTGVSAAQTRGDQMTLQRTIIGMDLGRTVHDSGEGSELVVAGIGIASQEAFAAGTISDPLIATDFPTRGWIWRAHYRVFGFAADQPAVFTRRIDMDLRSQRKLENGEAYLAIDVVAIEGASSTVNVTGLIRQLWLVS